MVRLDRTVRFDEVDAAGILYFPLYAAYAHEAMERLFDGVEGGYVALIRWRRVGFPAVKLESEFSAPLRYGDVVRIEARVERLGNRSCTIAYRVVRAADEVLAATMTHTVVITDLEAMRSIDMPGDVRRCLEQHLEPAAHPGSPK